MRLLSLQPQRPEPLVQTGSLRAEQARGASLPCGRFERTDRPNLVSIASPRAGRLLRWMLSIVADGPSWSILRARRGWAARGGGSPCDLLWLSLVLAFRSWRSISHGQRPRPSFSLAR